LKHSRQKAMFAKIKKHRNNIKLINQHDKARRKFLRGHGDGTIPISHTVNVAEARKREFDTIKKLRSA